MKKKLLTLSLDTVVLSAFMLPFYFHLSLSPHSSIAAPAHVRQYLTHINIIYINVYKKSYMQIDHERIFFLLDNIISIVICSSQIDLGQDQPVNELNL